MDTMEDFAKALHQEVRALSDFGFEALATGGEWTVIAIDSIKAGPLSAEMRARAEDLLRRGEFGRRFSPYVAELLAPVATT